MVAGGKQFAAAFEGDTAAGLGIAEVVFGAEQTDEGVLGLDFAAEDGAEEADAVGFFEQGVEQADSDEGLAGALVHRGNVHAVGHLGLHP